MNQCYFHLAMDEDGDDDTPSENGMVNGHGDGESSRLRVRLTYEDYKHMANLMTIYIRQEENKREGRTCMNGFTAHSSWPWQGGCRREGTPSSQVGVCKC